MNDAPEEERFLPTRQSLLSRLRNEGDQGGWQEFFDMYWRLIYGVGRKSGLSDSEAQDLVQETMIVVVRHMPEFRYDPAKGSFKSWLQSVIRSRLGEHWRKAKSVSRTVTEAPESTAATGTDFFEKVADDSTTNLDEIWQTEWEQHVLDQALRNVRTEVSPKQYLIFSMAVLKEIPLATIAEKLDVNLAQIYLAKHRVGKAVKAELSRVRKQMDQAGI